MAISISAFLTTGGLQVINRLLATQGPLHFTRAQLGKGVVTSEEAARARTTLIDPTTDASLVGVTYEGGQAVITVQYDNTGLQTGFFVNEIGLFVQDPDNSAKEVLYCYATFGDTPDWIAAQAVAIYVRTYKISTIVSDLQSITIDITPGAMVSQEQFEAEIKLTRAIAEDGISAMNQYIRAKIGHTNITLAEVEKTLHDHKVEFTPEVIDVNLTSTSAYPFNNSKQTIALTTVRKSKNYEIDIEIVSGGTNIGDIVVSDKLLNGFKVEYTGSASAVQLRIIVKGGMIT